MRHSDKTGQEQSIQQASLVSIYQLRLGLPHDTTLWRLNPGPSGCIFHSSTVTRMCSPPSPRENISHEDTHSKQTTHTHTLFEHKTEILFKIQHKATHLHWRETRTCDVHAFLNSITTVKIVKQTAL